MNGNAIVRIFATFALLFVALWVAFDIFTSGGNAVARSYMYLMIASGVYGLLSPRRAFYVLLFLTAYLDYFKRLMIFDSGLSRMDLYFVLGIAPCTLAGIAVSTLYQQFTGRLDPRPGLTILTFMTVLGSGMVLFLSLSGGHKGFRSLGDSVNAAAYLLLLFVVPSIFRTPGELRRMLKICIVIYMPAVAYMLIHFFRGSIFDWEMDYVKSGLTGEIRQLMERKFRYFGTMNSAANASTVFGLMLALICSGIWKYSPRPPYERRSSSAARLLLCVPIAIAMYATWSRMGWITCVASILAIWAFKRRVLTMVGYGVAIMAVIATVVASPYLLRHKILNKISEDIYSQQRTDEWGQTTNLSTLNDRLEGFYALVTNAKIWTPFGVRLSSYNEKAVLAQVQYHDLFTEALIRYGYVAILVGLGLGIALLLRLHRFVFFSPPGIHRELAVACLACGVCIVSGGVVNGAQLMTYPVNFFIWLLFAVVASVMMHAREQEALEPAPAADPDGDIAPWRRGVPRGLPPRGPAMPLPART